MARRQKREKKLTVEERLEQALVPAEEQPYSVPENWCWTYIKSAYEVTSSKRVHKEDWLSEGIPFYRTRELVKLSNQGYVDNELFISDELYRTFKATYGVPQIGDLLISGVGTIGIPYIIDSENPFYFKDGNVIWLKSKQLLNPKYTYYLYKSNYMDNMIHSMSSGTTVDTYTIVNANATPIPLPPSHEQQRIVDRIESLFAKLDEAKEMVQTVIDGFETRKAAILYKAFNGELSSSWRNVNGISDKTWHRKTLQEVCSMKITDGTHKTPVYCDSEQGVPFLSAKDVTLGSICWDNIKYITPELHEELYSRLAPQIDDILLAKNGTTGIAALVDVEDIFDIYVTLAVLRPDKDIVLPKYLLRIINSPICKKQFDEHLTGIGVPNLHLRDIKNVQIVVPSLEEQAEIVFLLDSLLIKEQQAKETAEAVLDQIEAMKESILARAFRGELGTNDPAEESAVEMLRQVL